MNFTHFVEPKRLVRRSCVDAGVSYEDRVARRKEEIESLQEALRILNGEDIAFLQKSALPGRASGASLQFLPGAFRAGGY